jgi:phosphatidylglycerol:prolipoprotein diacylglycerol transferase
MAYPHGTVPTTTPVHPTPIYETLTMGIVALLLWRWRHRWRPGTLFALWLLLAGTERFLVEFVRRNEDVLLGLTAAQLESLAMLAAGLVWVGVLVRRHGGLLLPAGGGMRRPAVA